MTSEQGLELKKGDYVKYIGETNFSQMQPLLDRKPREILSRGENTEYDILLYLRGIEGIGTENKEWFYYFSNIERVPTQQELANKNNTYFATDYDGSIFEYSVEPRTLHGKWRDIGAPNENTIKLFNGNVVPLECAWKDSLIKPFEKVKSDFFEGITDHLFPPVSSYVSLATASQKLKDVCNFEKGETILVKDFNIKDLAIEQVFKYYAKGADAPYVCSCKNSDELYGWKYAWKKKTYTPYTDFDNDWINKQVKGKATDKVYTIVGKRILQCAIVLRNNETYVCHNIEFCSFLENYLWDANKPCGQIE